MFPIDYMASLKQLNGSLTTQKNSKKEKRNLMKLYCLVKEVTIVLVKSLSCSLNEAIAYA